MKKKIKRELPKPIGKELNDFLEIVCEGIRGEYEKGWTYRKLKEDQKELKKYVSFCMKWAYEKGEIDGQIEALKKSIKIAEKK